jgi:hypothetical protein
MIRIHFQSVDWVFGGRGNTDAVINDQNASMNGIRLWQIVKRTRSASCRASCREAARPPPMCTRASARSRAPSSWNSSWIKASSSGPTDDCKANTTGAVKFPLAKSCPWRGIVQTSITNHPFHGETLFKLQSVAVRSLERLV